MLTPKTPRQIATQPEEPMRSLAAWRTVQGLYWLTLGIWLGALVMLVIAAAATFHTVSEYQPILPAHPAHEPVTSVRAVNTLAGAIVGKSLDNLRWMQWICAIATMVCLVLQSTVIANRRLSISGQWINTLRIVLVMMPVLILVADTAVISPKMKQERKSMHDLTQPSPQIERARHAFDRYHDLSQRLFTVQLVMLGCAALASAFVPDGAKTHAAASRDA